MTEYLKQTIKDEMIKLPKESQEVINSFGWEEISVEIGKKYLLDEEKVNKLQVEISLVMLGLAQQNFLKSNIENEVGLDEDMAKKISGDIIGQIFKPMVDILVENIKKSMGVRNIPWQQSIYFILSGGDYASFVRKVENDKRVTIKPADTSVKSNFSI